MKILILRFSSIGDIVLTTPVIRNIKEQVKDCELHYCTKKAYEGIVNDNPYIDKVICLNGGLNSLVHRLKAEKYDLIIDLHNNLRTSIIKLRLGVNSKAFDKLNKEKWLMTAFKINRLPSRHIVDRYMDVTKILGVVNDEKGLDYFIPDKDEVEMKWLPDAYQQGFVGVVVGAQLATKRLPYERLVELCDKINKPIVLIGGKEDAAIGEKVSLFFKRDPDAQEMERVLDEELNKKAIVFNGCGKFNLNQSADLIRKSSVIFTHDTGMMHIAAAFKKQVYSIWGNTIPEFGMYPYQTKFVIFENKNLSCRPCSKIGFDKCPKGHFKCMQEVKFNFYLP